MTNHVLRGGYGAWESVAVRFTANCGCSVCNGGTRGERRLAKQTLARGAINTREFTRVLCKCGILPQERCETFTNVIFCEK